MKLTTFAGAQNLQRGFVGPWQEFRDAAVTSPCCLALHSPTSHTVCNPVSQSCSWSMGAVCVGVLHKVYHSGHQVCPFVTKMSLMHRMR